MSSLCGGLKSPQHATTGRGQRRRNCPFPGGQTGEGGKEKREKVVWKEGSPLLITGRLLLGSEGC